MFQSCVVGFLENAVSLLSLQGFDDEFSPTLSWHHASFWSSYCSLVFLSQLQKCAKISSVHDARKAGSCNTKEEPSVSLTVHMASIEKRTGTAINRTVTVSSKLFSFTLVCAVYSNLMSVLVTQYDYQTVRVWFPTRTAFCCVFYMSKALCSHCMARRRNTRRYQG